MSKVYISGTSPLETLAFGAMVLGARNQLGPGNPPEVTFGDVVVEMPNVPADVWQRFSTNMVTPGTVPFDSSGKDTPTASALDYTLPYSMRSQIGEKYYVYLDVLSYMGDKYLPLLAIRGYALVVLRVLEAYGAAHGGESILGAFNDAVAKGFSPSNFWMGAVAVDPPDSYVITGPTDDHPYGKAVVSSVWGVLDAGSRIMQYLGAPDPSPLTRPTVPVDEYNYSVPLKAMGRAPSASTLYMGLRADAIDTYLTYYPDTMKVAGLPAWTVGPALDAGMLSLAGAIGADIPAPHVTPILFPLDLQGQPCTMPDGRSNGVYNAQSVCVQGPDTDPGASGSGASSAGSGGGAGAGGGKPGGVRYHGSPIDTFGHGGDGGGPNGAGGGKGNGNGAGNQNQQPGGQNPAATGGMSTGAKVAITTGVAAAAVAGAWKLGLFRKIGK